jgi:1-acyl-sn-glycerol-3-phosphate acyltransferase
MPPAAVRRPVTVALTLGVALLLLAAGPLLLALAALAQALGRPKPLIAVRLVLAYCVYELAVLAAAAGLWTASGAGRWISRPRFQTLHWRLLGWFVHGIAQRCRHLLGIQVQEECPEAAASALADPAPLIVLSRHAGPGDTFLLIDRLLSHHGRRPSVVLREAITLDPAIDLLTSRLPHAVIDSAQGEHAEAEIARLAGRLKPGGVLLLYPEGGNFTRARQRSARQSLRRRGAHRALAAAERMEHVLPPRPGGVRAARRAAPEARVLIVAHTGLGLAAFPREIYRDLPMRRTLRFRLWAVDAGSIPDSAAEEAAWLNGWWERIDEWVRSTTAGEGAADAAAERLSAESPA